MSMRLVAAELVESREILPRQWLQAYHAPDLASGSRAGQFVHVRPGDYSGLILRRPFSLNTVDPATGIVTIHFRTVGRGTDWFTRLRRGDSVDMLGPLGRPFEVDPRSRHLLLIAGGLGIAGVRMLADEAVREGRKVVLLFGAANAAEVYPSSLLPDEVEYIVATDDGSLGHPGYVTDLVTEYEAWADQAFACGPGADAGRPRPAGRRSTGAPRGRQARSQEGRRPGRPTGLAGGSPQGVPPGRDGAEHGLRGRRMPRLRGHGRDRSAPAGLSRGPGLRLGRDRLGGRLVMGSRLGAQRVGAWAGVVGALVITVGSIVTGLAYTGSQGEPYSPLNHWVSELGELKNSELAGLFNLALVVGGACFVVFMIGLVVARPGILRALAGVIGVVAGIGGLFVGVFPMDHLDQHGLAALTFFNFGWIAVALASIDFVLRPDARWPRWLAIVGAATVLAFVGFLVELEGITNPDGALAVPDLRLDVWSVAILEWLTLAGILLWVFLTGAFWLRALRRTEAG